MQSMMSPLRAHRTATRIRLASVCPVRVITLATESGRRRSQSGEFATPSGEDNLPAVLDQESFAGQGSSYNRT
jgi:hypothetical protein